MTKYAVNGGMQSSGVSPTMHDTAAECVACRCTMAPAPLRSSYIARCKTDSFDGASPDSALPFQSSFAMRAGSSAPRLAFVGVTNQPSCSRPLMLPLLPAVNPRPNSDLPNANNPS